MAQLVCIVSMNFHDMLTLKMIKNGCSLGLTGILQSLASIDLYVLYFAGWFDLTTTYCMNPVGTVVREGLRAGEFMPGSGQYPVEKLPEQDLRLLKSQTELEPTLMLGSPAAPRPEANMESPNAAVGTPQSGRESSTSVHPSPGNHSIARSPQEISSANASPNPSGIAGHDRGKTAVRKNDSKYDKYKDGSYWKSLDCSWAI